MPTIKNIFYLPGSLLLLLLISTSFLATAQLQANFTVDKNGGCSPVSIAYTNTSTGTTANTIYQWDLGNGHSSSLADAGATYVLEQSYTITLTITDGNKTSTQTKQITVYKRPAVNFSFNVTKGCLPVPVNFTASATAGDGSIANYFWDFGDGSIEQTPSAQIQHTYNFVQNNTVGLTVTNSYGCYTSVEKNAVEVLPAITANFSTDKKVLCSITDPAKFINNSTGPGTLSYAWDFGDGNISTEVSPSHVYNKKGTYSVKLTLSNKDGCVSINTKTDYLNVHNYGSDITVPSLICASSEVIFTDNSTPIADSKIWVVDHINQCYWCNAFNYTFNDSLAHTIQLINTYGTCVDTATKQLIVKLPPVITPFIINIPPNCGAPVTVHFKDTTAGVTNWLWYFDWSNSEALFNGNNAVNTYTTSWGHNVRLTVSNAAGCSASEVQNVYTGPVSVSVGVINTSYLGACDSVHATFKAFSTDSIVTYFWDLGDGTTSTNAQPEHTFTKEGDFNVVLKYVTKSGCTGTSDINSARVHVAKRHPVDITSSGTTICGNTPVTFTITGSGNYNAWDFGDGTTSMSQYNNTVTHQYTRDSTYTISVRFSTDSYFGFCPDTLIKKDFIKVLAPFPKILSSTNTCDGERNAVIFKDTSYKAITWDWNFGDGTVHSNTPHSLTHNYAATGAYKVILTNTSGQCSVTDSTMVYVLLKQKLKLSSNVSVTCSSDVAIISVTNMEKHPTPNWYFDAYYYLSALQYGDNTNYAYNGYIYLNGAWQTTANFQISGLDPTKKDIRIISTSGYFSCQDTTNFIPLKINGPNAGFKLIDGSPCFAYPVIIQDTSVIRGNFPIKKWEWDFGDGTALSVNTGGLQTHTYAAPGHYFVQLKVTDTNGCTSSSGGNYYGTQYANPSGPRSAFYYNPAQVTPNTAITFNNSTNNYNSSNTQYQWIFGDGGTSTEYSPVHTFSKTSIDTVKLISINTDTHCQDTAIQIINVKLINTHFSFAKFYVGANTCPPVIVHFTNTSYNAVSVAWDFGDGSKADNQNNPSHTYYKPGTYKVIMYGYGYNGTTDTTVDSITVRAPNAKLKADKLSGCLSQTITFNAAVTNARYIIWDFADGSIQQTPDTFAVHQYANPGLYNPLLIMTDSSGCSIIAKLPDTIIIDALKVSFPQNNNHFCDSANILFTPNIISVALDSFHQTLLYKWNFGTGKVADTANASRPSFNYNNPGKYIVNLQVQSPYGCIKQATDTIVVVKKSRAIISGPLEICEGLTAQFTGQANPANSNLLWNWNFGTGTISASQNPLPVLFANLGNFKISLIIVNDGCADSSLLNFIVHANPIAIATPVQAIVCLGKSIQLTARGANIYSWLPVTGLDNSAIATPLATPPISTNYKVTVINNFGCKNTDSVSITVAMPFTIKAPADTAVCAGNSVHLYTTGASSYSWINLTTGLSNTKIADPFAIPLFPIIYTVVGYDAYHCFTDTALVKINVHALPTIIHEPAIEMLTGGSVQLLASGSRDITNWNWMPPDYLSCSNCASPVSTPLNPVIYVVTGTNDYGCSVADTVVIKLICSISHIYVPNIFSPNSDAKNDVFYITGRGVKTIKSLRIFDRWGKPFFDKANGNVGDRSGGWDGTIKGDPAPPGAYVYIAELICNTGEVFVLKGSVILVR